MAPKRRARRSARKGRKARRATKKRRRSKRKAKGKKRSRRRTISFRSIQIVWLSKMFFICLSGRKKKASSAAQ